VTLDTGQVCVIPRASSVVNVVVVEVFLRKQKEQARRYSGLRICITTFMAFYIVLFCQGRLLIAMGRMAFILNPKIALAHLPLSAVLRSRRRSPSSQKLVALSRRTRRQEQF